MSKQPRTIEVFPSWWPFLATQLFGIIFIKKGRTLSDVQIRHEMIHYEQQRELAFILFLPLYIIEFIVRFLFTWKWMKTYRAISFEQEAYSNQKNVNYLGEDGERVPFTWWRVLMYDLKQYLRRNWLVLIVGGYVAYTVIGLAYYEIKDYFDNSPPPEPKTLEEIFLPEVKYKGDLRTTAEVFTNYLHRHRRDKESLQLLLGQEMAIEGYVQYVDLNDSGEDYLHLSWEDGCCQINCFFTQEERTAFENLKAGDRVSVVGIYNGTETHPELKDCWLE